VEEVESEASNIWCPETRNLKPLVKCFISIGAGNPGKNEIQDNPEKFPETLEELVTETEMTADRFIERWGQHSDTNGYFRFNVAQGLQNVGLEEYQRRDTIEATTQEYLDEHQQKRIMGDCVSNLKLKARA
jgi:hypothetical protein